MRIRTQFIITLFLFGLVLIAISVSAILTNQMIAENSEQGNISGRIAQGAGELSYLANDYVIYRESQQIERWQTRFAAFSNDVKGLQGNNAEQQALVSNIQANTQRLVEVFNSIISTVGSSSPGQGYTIDPALLRVSWSRMAVQSQALVSEASRLSQLTDSEAHNLQQTNITVIVILIVVLFGYFIVNYLVTQRRALKGLAKIQAGTAVIGSGNLDFRIEEKGNDEIGDLSRAVNRMTADLKAVTASRTDLEREIVNRNDIEEELWATNESLQDQTQKLEKEIEERKKAEEALEKISFILSEGQKIAHIGSFEYVAETQTTVWSDEENRIYGLDPGTPSPSYDIMLAKFIHPDDASLLHETFSKAMRSSSTYELEHRIVRPDGTVRVVYDQAHPYFDEEGKLIRYIGATLDITERKKVEAEIAHLASFPELNPNPIIELDASGAVKYANPAAITLFPDLMDLGHKHPFLAGLDVIVRNRKNDSIERDINLGDSWFEQTFAYSPASQTYRLYARDVTERKKAEEALNQRTIDLEAANDELESFSYSVSHDLKAPLRSIDGFSGALLEDYGEILNAGARNYLDRIRNSALLMDQLIDGMLQLSRLTRAEMNLELVDLSAVARSIAEEMKLSQPERTAEINIASGIIARGDKVLLEALLRNLLENAWKFTAKCRQTTIEFGITAKDNLPVYYVRDNGVGFDMKYSDKLFKPFSRLHDRDEYQGTGIGLANVQRIVHRHGGRIWAESETGKGAAFYFTLGN